MSENKEKPKLEPMFIDIDKLLQEALDEVYNPKNKSLWKKFTTSLSSLFSPRRAK